MNTKFTMPTWHHFIIAGLLIFSLATGLAALESCRKTPAALARENAHTQRVATAEDMDTLSNQLIKKIHELPPGELSWLVGDTFQGLNILTYDSVQGIVTQMSDFGSTDSIWFAWNKRDPDKEYIEFAFFRDTTLVGSWKKDMGGYETAGDKNQLYEVMDFFAESLDR